MSRKCECVHCSVRSILYFDEKFFMAALVSWNDNGHAKAMDTLCCYCFRCWLLLSTSLDSAGPNDSYIICRSCHQFRDNNKLLILTHKISYNKDILYSVNWAHKWRANEMKNQTVNNIFQFLLYFAESVATVIYLTWRYRRNRIACEIFRKIYVFLDWHWHHSTINFSYINTTKKRI